MTSSVLPKIRSVHSLSCDVFWRLTITNCKMDVSNPTATFWAQAPTFPPLRTVSRGMDEAGATVSEDPSTMQRSALAPWLNAATTSVLLNTPPNQRGTTSTFSQIISWQIFFEMDDTIFEPGSTTALSSARVTSVTIGLHKKDPRTSCSGRSVEHAVCTRSSLGPRHRHRRPRHMCEGTPGTKQMSTSDRCSLFEACSQTCLGTAPTGFQVAIAVQLADILLGNTAAAM